MPDEHCPADKYKSGGLSRLIPQTRSDHVSPILFLGLEYVDPHQLKLLKVGKYISSIDRGMVELKTLAIFDWD